MLTGVKTFYSRVLLPRPAGNIMWWGNRCGSITTNLKGNFKQIGILPDLPDNYAFNTMYPLTATISPLAYDPKKNYAAGMVIFGGGGQVRGACVLVLSGRVC